jgi:hypothetical protein
MHNQLNLEKISFKKLSHTFSQLHIFSKSFPPDGVVADTLCIVCCEPDGLLHDAPAFKKMYAHVCIFRVRVVYLVISLVISGEKKFVSSAELSNMQHAREALSIIKHDTTINTNTIFPISSSSGRRCSRRPNTKTKSVSQTLPRQPFSIFPFLSIGKIQFCCFRERNSVVSLCILSKCSNSFFNSFWCTREPFIPACVWVQRRGPSSIFIFKQISVSQCV